MKVEPLPPRGHDAAQFRFSGTVLDRLKADATNLHLSHSYSLSGGHGQFSINPATGQIITSSLLDREERANYQLLVVATDGGQPQGLSSSATVSVTVADINDNPPRFHHHPYVTHIPASTAAGLDLCTAIVGP